MADDLPQPLTPIRLRTPEAAGVAGIIFSVLLATSIVLIQISVPDEAIDDREWLGERTGLLGLAVTLVPFAGIAFLWFIGVIRDQIGEHEDRFFSTVFLGSGLLFLAGLFMWLTLIAAIVASAEAEPDTWTSSGAFVFGVSMIEVMGGVVTLRMAAVFMFSSGTIWLRTEMMPRWLIWVTYLVGLALLIVGPAVRESRLVLPLWVLIVSILILRSRNELTIEDES
ncbi:MAG: hypothetical protein OEV40_00245 [Acidimicrobiia bacterium]|nr:hypothetical protein [Acidimicrobiia bacterium]